MRKKVLSLRFFNRPTITVAKDLLGKFLIRNIGRKTIAVQITEVEAYDGPHDKASHASRGRTPRNTPMFGEAGRFYVYFTYGMHWMLNIVTGPNDYPAAVLIRSGKLKVQSGKSAEINGPARLTKYLKIDKRLNGKSADWRNGLWLENRGTPVRKVNIVARPRVGVDYAGRWAKKLYNFKIRQ